MRNSEFGMRNGNQKIIGKRKFVRNVECGMKKFGGLREFVIMGIVNVTDDSFYDGGRYVKIDDAVGHALKLVDEGADIIDVGGSSSRPGATLLSPEEEIEKVVPVIKKIVDELNARVNHRDRVDHKKIKISIDTTWAQVASAAVDVGADIINDISAGRIDPKIIDVAAEKKCNVILTHSRKTPKDMQVEPHYNNVIDEVCGELQAAIKNFESGGVAREKIIVDPGFGFAKNVEHNIELLRGIDKIINMGYPTLIALSRKSFIGAITNRTAEERLAGTLAATAAAYAKGARMFRVHDVKETHDFLKTLDIFYV